MSNQFVDVPGAIETIARGEIVIVCDDEDHANEGDLTMAAELVTPEDINFMIIHGRGLICLLMSHEMVDRLGIHGYPSRPFWRASPGGEEKLLSLFEEHTQIITCHKAGKPREFGRKVLIEEVDGGIVSRYEILEEVGREHPHLPASLEAHQEHFGRAPELLAADRGLYSANNERLARQAGVKRVVLPKRAGVSRTSGSSTRSNAGSQARLQVQSGDRRSHQRPCAHLRAGSLPGARRRRDE